MKMTILLFPWLHCGKRYAERAEVPRRLLAGGGDGPGTALPCLRPQAAPPWAGGRMAFEKMHPVLAEKAGRVHFWGALLPRGLETGVFAAINKVLT